MPRFTSFTQQKLTVRLAAALPIPTELTLTGLSSSSYTADSSGLLFVTLDSSSQAQQVINVLFQGTTSVGATGNRIRLTMTRQSGGGLLTVDYLGFFDASYVSVVSGSTIRIGDWGNFEISNITTYHTLANMAAGSVTNQVITGLTIDVLPFTAPVAPGGIGAPYGGGYYAGNIMTGGNAYYLIVAPKATGEANRAWKNATTAGPNETYTLNDGFAATEAMVAAGNSTVYPAAHFCRNLTIGGFTDWYMPSRDELELCFRNFKPGSGSNFIGSRPDSTFQYPEGDNVLVDPNEDGVNANSIPPGGKYTSGFPTQSGSVIFRDPSGSEFFITNFGYLTSSQNDNSSVWMQWFGAGNAGEQVWTNKDIARQVRAVRRVRYL